MKRRGKMGPPEQTAPTTLGEGGEWSFNYWLQLPTDPLWHWRAPTNDYLMICDQEVKIRREGLTYYPTYKGLHTRNGWSFHRDGIPTPTCPRCLEYVSERCFLAAAQRVMND